MNDTTPAYVAIAGEIARKIRSGELPAGTQLPSHPELAEQHEVSEIVIRRAIELLRSQGLVRTIRRRGTFVAERPTLLRVSPERQLQTAEDSLASEAGSVHVDRDKTQVVPPPQVVEALGISLGDEVAHVITRISVDGTPVSISDTYEILDRHRAPAEHLEETLAVHPPSEDHASWLRTPPGEAVITIRQRYLTGDRTVMLSDITYPSDRYAAFVFRMQLSEERDQ